MRIKDTYTSLKRVCLRSYKNPRNFHNISRRYLLFIFFLLWHLISLLCWTLKRFHVVLVTKGTALLTNILSSLVGTVSRLKKFNCFSFSSYVVFISSSHFRCYFLSFSSACVDCICLLCLFLGSCCHCCFCRNSSDFWCWSLWFIFLAESVCEHFKHETSDWPFFWWLQMMGTLFIILLKKKIPLKWGGWWFNFQEMACSGMKSFSWSCKDEHEIGTAFVDDSDPIHWTGWECPWLTEHYPATIGKGWSGPWHAFGTCQRCFPSNYKHSSGISVQDSH